jgi:hypothetical protein
LPPQYRSIVDPTPEALREVALRPPEGFFG